MTSRIGVLGGTFDPIHIGHLAIAEDVRVTLRLDRVLFVPAAQQPFKRSHLAPAADRLAMVELACADNAAFSASRVEIDRAGVSYTVATLEALAALNNNLFFIMGSDALVDLPTWREAARLPALAHFVAVRRPGVAVDSAQVVARLPTLSDRLTVVDGPRLDISSSEIRQRAAENRSLRYLLPDSVIGYLTQHQLYRSTMHAEFTP